MRSSQTKAEKVLWDKLRAKRFHDIKFRRQVPIGIYIADFMCAKYRLVIEIDGGSHAREGGGEYDEHREEYLKSRRLRVIRFSNRDVLNNLGGVLKKIYETARFSSSP